MTYKRLIARIDFKDNKVIKGIQLEGLRPLGFVEDFTKKYYSDGIDEILLLDSVASLFEKETVLQLISRITSDCFVPVTIGGGIRSIEDADSLFRAGADKVAINTAALRNPQLVTDISKKYGSQAVVVHIEAKATVEGTWNCYFDNGREDSQKSVADWIIEVESRGAGEILVSSVDRDGTKFGPDFELIAECRQATNLPLVVSSGFRNISHIEVALNRHNVQGVAIGSLLHYELSSVSGLRSQCLSRGLAVRGVG